MNFFFVFYCYTDSFIHSFIATLDRALLQRCIEHFLAETEKRTGKQLICQCSVLSKSRMESDVVYSSKSSMKK